MTRRLLGLVAAALALGLFAGLLLHLAALRESLGAELRRHQQALAPVAAAALAPYAAQPALLAERAGRLAEQAGLQSLRVRAGMEAALELQRSPAAMSAPSWFAAAITRDVPAGEATADGPPTVQVRLQADPAAAIEAAWRGTLAWMAWGLAATVVVVLATLALLRQWRSALAAAAARAREIGGDGLAALDGAPPPGAVPELDEIARALDAAVLRLRGLFDAQAAQVAQLRQRVQTDAVTGLPVREQFVSRLADLLSDPVGPAVALLLVRVPALERLNERHGREATDRLLAALADVLLTYVDRVAGACAGRLNGTDFALGLPAAGIARETAEALQRALRATPPARLAGARFLLGGCDGLREIAAGEALAAADAALARTEAGDTSDPAQWIVIDDLPDARGGGRAWREQLEQALQQSRVRLGAYPVVDAQGTLIHLECPLRAQLEPGGEYQVARRWLALAARSGLLHEFDRAAIELALAAIEADGRPRCVHVAARSFASAECGARGRGSLEAAPMAARRLAIEWTDSERSASSVALRSALAQWRHAGVTVGVEHAGASPQALPALKELGVQFVKIDARHLRGLAQDDAVRGYARSLVTLVHSLGLVALAEGIDEPLDLQALWALGFDGATGTAVRVDGV